MRRSSVRNGSRIRRAKVAPFKTVLRDRVTTTSKKAPRVELRDLLVLPANYEPGQRLPLVVQFYPDTETYGGDWYGVDNPRTKSDLNTSMFVGRGYAVLNAGVAILKACTISSACGAVSTTPSAYS